MRLLPVLALLLVAVGFLTALAWRRAGEDRYAGLREEAETLVAVVRGEAVESARTVATAEEQLARRLAAALRRADVEVSVAQAPPKDVLERIAAEERVGRLFLLDAEGRVSAWARHPPLLPGAPAALSEGQLERIEREDAEKAVGRLAPSAGEAKPEGIQPNAFGTRERFGVAYGRREGGSLLARADADELLTLGLRFGLGPTLQRIALQDGVLCAAVLDQQGLTVVDGSRAAPGTAGCGRRDGDRAGVRAEAKFVSDSGTWVASVVLSTERADAAVTRSRTAILLGAGIAGIVAAALMGLLLVRESRHRKAQALVRARAEEERRLAEMGAVAGLVTHELSNPLNAVRLGLRVLRDSPKDRPPTAILGSLEEEVGRMGRTLESFLAIARSGEHEDGTIGPALLQRVHDRVAEEASRRRVRVDVQSAPDAPSVRGNANVLEQALTGLVRNAVQASPESEAVRVGWERGDDGGARLFVEDRGSGFPAEDRDRLFRLGASERAGGHGLGLPLAQRFVRAHGGTIALLDAAGGGARVEIRLPAADARDGRTRG